MTFPLEFDLLMIGVCTFIQGKNKKKQKKNKNKNKTKTKQKQNKKTKKQKNKKTKKKCKDMFVSHILLHRVGFISGGLNEIFMRDELRESSLRSFVPWIMTDMYLI